MKLLSYGEAAAILRCSPVSLRRRVMLGQLPHLKPYGPRGRVFFLQEDLEAFLLASRKGGADAQD